MSSDNSSALEEERRVFILCGLAGANLREIDLSKIDLSTLKREHGNGATVINWLNQFEPPLPDYTFDALRRVTVHKS